MKLTYLKSSTVIVEANGLRILMDPWLVDGEYYGSWAQYPAFDWSQHSIGPIDFIYVSHIHPDHLSPLTMARLSKSVPVLIHDYASKFMKRNIEMMGFETREIPHNRKVHLGKGVSINILAADDCNPEICGKFFGCAVMVPRSGSTQIDSLCILDDGKRVLVNTNDCPYALSSILLPKILNEYGNIDLLLVGYSGAGPYPQCFSNLTAAKKKAAAESKRKTFLDQGLRFIEGLQPRYIFPFAGQYTLAGRLSVLDDLRGVPEVEEAADYFKANNRGSLPILLNTGQTFDVSTGRPSADYVPTDIDAKRVYRDTILANRQFEFETDQAPLQADLEFLMRVAFQRMDSKRVELGLMSNTVIYVDLGGYFGRAPMNGGEFTIREKRAEEPNVVATVAPRLLKRLLSGPKFAHWNNADIGSHIEYNRTPDSFERGIYECMNYFHA